MNESQAEVNRLQTSVNAEQDKVNREQTVVNREQAVVKMQTRASAEIDKALQALFDSVRTKNMAREIP